MPTDSVSPVDASSPAPFPARKTNFGAVALAFAAALVLPMIVGEIAMRFRLPLPRNIEQNVSDFIFDYGFIWFLFTLLFIVIGLTRRGSSRRCAPVALGLLLISVLLLFVG
ncbi:MAG TPA: hypothetical protein VLI90_11540 [Tepidisphaeraceae bacterium]|nr:hypothetical protein [Tepidisphaeraceae bacterium]